MLTNKHVDEVARSIMAILKHLDDMEVTRVNKQKKEEEKKKIERELKNKRSDFVDRLFVKCKEYGGPVTFVRQLKVLVSKKSTDLKTLLGQEIKYQRVTHPRDSDIRRDIYKVNKLLLMDRILNLTDPR